MYRYLLLLLSAYTLGATAQVNIMMYPLQSLQMKPADMFRADVLNTDNKPVQLFFTGTITNTQTRQKQVSAQSKVITVNPGSMQLSEGILFPEYTFFSPELQQTGSLPYGNYMVCLKAFVVGGIEESASACEDIELMPLSPPLLLSPEHESTIQEDYPLLVWLPPMPVGKEKVLYDLKLVELMPNQTAYDAIQKNFATLEQQNISGTTLQYPANAMRLEAGKKYAWKVSAVTADRKPIGETEVWWFTKAAAGPAIIEEPTADRYYIILDEESNKKKVVVKEKLKIVSQDYLDDQVLQYRILNAKGAEISKENIQLTAEGNGKFVFLFTNPGKLAGENLQLIVTTPKGRKKFITFTFIKS